MAQVSKYPVSKEVYTRILDIFAKTVVSCKRKDQATLFLEEFFTPTEQIMLTKRLAIAFLLLKKYNYLEISKVLHVSTSTIRNVSISLKTKSYLLKKVKKILKDEEIEKFLTELGEKILKLLASGGSKSGAWKYLDQELESKRKSKTF